MYLMEPMVWASTFFAEGSHPSEMTVRHWMETGVVPVVMVNGRPFVDADIWLISVVERDAAQRRRLV